MDCGGKRVDTSSIYYLTTAKDDYVPRYVGKSKDPTVRLASHIKRALKLGFKTKLYAWIRSRVNEGQEVLACKIQVGVGGEAEKFWIKAYRALSYDLLNLTEGGDGGAMPAEVLAKTKATKANRFYPSKHGLKRGWAPSPEQRQAQSTAMKKTIAERGGHWTRGRRVSEVERAARSLMTKGRKQPPSFGEKLSKILKGRPCHPNSLAAVSKPKTETAKENMRKSSANRVEKQRQTDYYKVFGEEHSKRMKTYWEDVRAGRRVRKIK